MTLLHHMHHLHHHECFSFRGRRLRHRGRQRLEVVHHTRIHRGRVSISKCSRTAISKNKNKTRSVWSRVSNCDGKVNPTAVRFGWSSARAGSCVWMHGHACARAGACMNGHAYDVHMCVLVYIYRYADTIYISIRDQLLSKVPIIRRLRRPVPNNTRDLNPLSKH